MLKNIKNKVLSKLFPNRFWLLKDLFPQYDIGVGSYGKPQILSWGENATLKMGNYCSIALDVQILLGGEHDMERVTTYPFDTLEQYSPNFHTSPKSKGDIVIGSDVWICRGAMILSGVTIGDGAVIAARAVVTHDVPVYGVVAGNPAKLIKYRFDEPIRTRLMEIKWWDWSEARINKTVPYLVDDQINKFLEAVDLGKI